MGNVSLELALANKIKELRTANGLSMSELGKLCGLTSQRIYELEQGNKIPRLTTLIKIATGLKVSVFEILDEPLGRTCKACANSSTCPFFKPV
jgi:transcriptional regulator with XRE-family HTH domain